MKTNLIILIAALGAGCTVTNYQDGRGTVFSRVSILNNSKIGRLKQTEKGIELDSYQNDQISGAAAITAAAVEAAVKGAKTP